MKPLKKKELLELQRKYRTDKKIGEALGGIPAYLIRYWRRKKGIGPYNYPKYSEQQIRELWERYGDDTEAGQRLGISRQAFRRWRSQYNILDKPRQLKLEQLQLPLNGARAVGILGAQLDMTLHDLLSLRAETAPRRAQRGDSGTTGALTLKADLTGTFAMESAHEGRAGRDTYSFRGITLKPVSAEPSNGPVRSSRPGKLPDRFSKAGMKEPPKIIMAEAGPAAGLAGMGHLVVRGPEKTARQSAGNTVTIDLARIVRVVLTGEFSGSCCPFDLTERIRNVLGHDLGPDTLLEISGEGLSTMDLHLRFNIGALTHPLSIQGVYFTRLIPAGRGVKDRGKTAIIDLDNLKPMILSYARRRSYDIDELRGEPVSRVILGGVLWGHSSILEKLATEYGQRRLGEGVTAYLVPAGRKELLKMANSGILETFVNQGWQLVQPDCELCKSLHAGDSEKATISTIDMDFRDCIDKGHDNLFFAGPQTAFACGVQGRIADLRSLA